MSHDGEILLCTELFSVALGQGQASGSATPSVLIGLPPTPSLAVTKSRPRGLTLT